MPIDDVTEAWRRRIDALFAKAESTPFGPEAEALIAKAHQLMVRYSVTQAMLGEGRDEDRRIGCTPFLIRPPYATAQASLLGAIASANTCRVVLGSAGRGPQHGTVVGQSTDRHNTLAMFAWLSLHAREAMKAAVVPSWESPRRFRHAFLLAFAVRIGDRLRRATAEVERAGAPDAMRIVLHDRDAALDAFMDAEFPHLRRVTRTGTSAAGASGGRAAADRAGLSQSLRRPSPPELSSPA